MADSKISQLTSWTPTTSDTWVMVQWWVNKKFTFWDLPTPTSVTTALNNKVDKTTTVNWQALSSNVTLTKTDVGLWNVDNTSDSTKNAATATLTNKTISWADNTITNIAQSSVTNLTTDLAWKQATLVSGTNIKTVNGNSLLWSWDVTISAAANIAVKDEWTTLTSTVSSFNFVWSGVTATNTGNDVTVTITGGSWSGDVVWPASSTNNNVVLFDGTTGKLIKDSWVQLWALASLDTVDTAQIATHAVTNTQLAQMNSNTVKGRLSWNGTPQDIAMADLPISTAAQSALDLKADDNSVVKLTWDQTIAWIKTFTSPVLSNSVRLTEAAAVQWEVHADLSVIVRAATTANITLSGTQTIDWVSLVANNLVLVKNQSTWSQNGVYVVSAGAWTRATNYNTTDHFNRRYIYAISGTTNTATLWICTTRNPVVWTTATTFAQVPLGIGTAANQAAAGNHTHTSIATTAASSIGAALSYRYTNRTATATTATTDLVVEFTWSTASQIETMPDGVALSNNSWRILVYRNSATVPWTIRQSASNTLDWSSADYTLAVWETLTVLNKADNVWISLNKPVGGWWGTQIRKMFAIAWTIWATWTNVANTVVMDRTATLQQTNLWYWTAWNGTLTIDVNKNWTTVYATTKPWITTTNQSSINSGTITTAGCVSWDVYTIDIDAVPWTPWTDLYVELVFTS